MVIAAAIALLLTSTPQTTPAAQIESLPPCDGQLSVAVDDEGGSNAGMSQNGALLVIRNIGAKACRITSLPAIGFRDTANRVLAISRKPPVGMHPGPVVLPVGIAAGAEATTLLHWVTGDVYDGHNCATPARLTVKTEGAPMSVAWGMRMCGPAHGPIPFDQGLLRPDPVLVLVPAGP